MKGLKTITMEQNTDEISKNLPWPPPPSPQFSIFTSSIATSDWWPRPTIPSNITCSYKW